MIFVNFKTFAEGTGKRGVFLAKILAEVAESSQVKIVPVVQAGDIKEVCAATTLEVWVQKIDPIEFGAHTGAIVPEAVVEDGAAGTFLNHSEAKFVGFNELAKASDRAKEVGLKTLIFAKDLEELKKICLLKPTFVSYEPPELVGSSTRSVASVKPEIIAKAVILAKEQGLPLIVGAGIHCREDVKKSVELGATGIAVATDIVKAQDPEKELRDLIGGFE
jgi:triosephosphate isomerase